MIPRCRRDRVLVVSPHLDDAVLSVGATIAAMTAAGGSVLVCTVFAGDPLPPLSPVADDFHADCGLGRDAMLMRRSEDMAALRILGAKPVHLDFLDAIYRRTDSGWLCDHPRAMFDPDRCPDQALVDDIRRALSGLISRVIPTQVWTCAALGRHIDHRATRAAVTAECAAVGKLLLWEDLPYGCDGRPLRLPMAQPPLEVSAQQVQRKLAAVSCYTSQLRMLWPDTDWARLLADHAAANQAAGGAELLWQASQSPAMYL